MIRRWAARIHNSVTTWGTPLSSKPVFACTFEDIKIIKSRGVAQIICEVALEKADEALATLGGIPIPGKSRWVAIAALIPDVANREEHRSNDQVVGVNEGPPNRLGPVLEGDAPVPVPLTAPVWASASESRRDGPSPNT